MSLEGGNFGSVDDMNDLKHNGVGFVELFKIIVMDAAFFLGMD